MAGEKLSQKSADDITDRLPPCMRDDGGIAMRWFVPLLPLSFCISAFAVETNTWQQAGMDDFEKGALKNLSLSSEGKLCLAPAVKEVLDASAAFLWAVARDSKGDIYVGGGGLGSSQVKLLSVDRQGTIKTVAELDGISIQAIAVDSRDRVYAATSPDGKIYRVDGSSKPEVFYDPKAKYIWGLAFDKSGNLFVATGDQGEIHKVSPSGSGSVFFRTEEAHAMSLAIDSKGNLIVGTDPSGLIIRVSPAGQGFVLYQAPKREITAVAVAPDDTIYAAGIGNKQATPPPASTQLPSPAPATASALGGAITVTGAPARPGALPPPAAAQQAITGGSEIYRIQSDGYPRKVWSNAQELVYALAFDGQGKPVVGTGNHGYIYRLDSDYSYTRLVTLSSTQVTGLMTAPDGTVYALTGNIGKMFSIGPRTETSGTFESDVLDAGAFTYWGRITADPEPQAGLTIETRSGNVSRPQQNWSAWEKLNSGRVASPSARFLQYRLTLSGSAWTDEIAVAYQMKNVAPVIEEIETTPFNYKFPAPATASNASSSPANLTLPALGRKQPSNSASSASSGANSPAMNWSKGWAGVRWLASDDNGDTLQFKV
ncbi:MAG: SMP-30/gluconolactonase/LRE family protein, partial [Bryobacterales bacterium]|nr:SMP-30/gluconolactonase/LRE family protein [Bryobacterales bacterium]